MRNVTRTPSSVEATCHSSSSELRKTPIKPPGLTTMLLRASFSLTYFASLSAFSTKSSNMFRDTSSINTLTFHNVKKQELIHFAVDLTQFEHNERDTGYQLKLLQEYF